MQTDFEKLAKEHKVLEVQYGEAKITTGSALLRLILLHAGVGLGLRQTVALVAESGGPAVSHVTLHQKMRLAGPYLRALVGGLTKGSAQASPATYVKSGSRSASPGGKARLSSVISFGRAAKGQHHG